MNKQQITQLYDYFKEYGNCSGNYTQCAYIATSICGEQMGKQWISESYELIYKGKIIMLIINGESGLGLWSKLDIKSYNLIELEEINE